MNGASAADVTKLKIHFFYVALLLGLCIVALVTINWTKISGFIDYLNVAAGVTSIALGILAIIYSFVTTGSFNRSLGAVEDSASQVARTAEDLADVLKSGQALQTRAEKRTEELHKLVGSMRDGLEELGTGLRGLEATTSQIAGSVAAIPDRIDAIEKQARYAPAVNVAEPARRWDKAAIQNYLVRSSLMGIILLHAIALATTQRKYLNVEKLLPANADYMWGYLIASIAAGVVEIEDVDPKSLRKIVRLKDPSQDLLESITEEWARRGNKGEEFMRNMVAAYTPEKIQESLVDGAGDEIPE